MNGIKLLKYEENLPKNFNDKCINQSKKNTFKKLNAEQIIYSLIQSNRNKMVFNNHISQV